MKKIIHGIHEFQDRVFGAQRELFERLAQGQKPLALFITCSDSRIDPNLLTQTQPGELFVIRNAGNLVPRYGSAQSGEAGTIEYAVAVLKVKDLIVCGHSQCGAMGGVLHPEQLGELEAVKDWLKHAEATARTLKEKYSDVTDEKERLKAAVEENVLAQLENLRTHPSVEAAVSRDQLTLHGWTYEFETGRVFAYDPQKQAFLPLDEVEGTSGTAT